MRRPRASANPELGPTSMASGCTAPSCGGGAAASSTARSTARGLLQRSGAGARVVAGAEEKLAAWREAELVDALAQRLGRASSARHAQEGSERFPRLPVR